MTFRCDYCGRFYPTCTVCPKDYYVTRLWNPKPRRKPQYVNLKCTDGKTRRLVTQK